MVEISLGGLEVLGRPFLCSGSGRETLPQVRKGSGDLPKGPEVVGRPSRSSEVVVRPYRRSGSGRETLP